MKKLSKKKLFYFIIHLSIWSLLFLIPFFFSHNSPFNIEFLSKEWYIFYFKFYWLFLLFCMIIFYSNYFYLINHFLFNKKGGLFIIINIILITLAITSTSYLRTFPLTKEKTIHHEKNHIKKREKPKERQEFHQKKSPYFVYFYEFLILSIPLLIAIAIKITTKWDKIDKEKEELNHMRLQAELQHLKYQIQPHFFFNSLNNIYSLIDISQEKAKETIYNLSKLMRYLLYESNTDKINLSKEIDFIKNYITLMKIRSSDQLKINEDFPLTTSEIKVAPLLYVSLVENAFKHGISATEPTHLTFSIYIENNKIVFITKNINLPKTIQSDRSQSGIGLENLKKRLELIYPKKHIFTTEIINNEFIAKIIIELS